MVSRKSKNGRFIRGSVQSMIGLFALVIALFNASVLHAQSEDEIKAAFLLNFARYVEWPESAFSSAGTPLRICVLDENGFDSVVSGIVEGKTVGPRTVEVQAVTRASGSDRCHILFVGRDLASAGDIRASLGKSSVFTVSDDEDFARSGGVANFFRSNNRVRFEINPNAAESAGLKISSQLLRLAQLVE